MFFVSVIKFVNFQKRTLQSRFLGEFPRRKGHTSGSHITKKIFWQNHFCINSGRRLLQNKMFEGIIL